MNNTSHTSELPTHRGASEPRPQGARIVILVDLSAVIFVVLALAWAVYLIPKALKHHDELASDRLVEGHSDKVRILSRHGKKDVVVEPVAQPVVQPVVEAAVTETVAPVTTRAAARRAAKRRRRVLSVLVLALAVVAGLAGYAVVPWWSTAIPGGMVVLFLLGARLSVRRIQARRKATVAARSVARLQTLGLRSERSERLETTQPASSIDTTPASQDLVDLLNEDTIGVPRQEIEAALADDGSLWDPLPMTLPTYVNKATARRTVRTIELTGINSSGHDEADSALAREAAESSKGSTDTEGKSRKAAGA